MTYFADLSPYEYYHHSDPALNVGWLDGEHPFDTCDLPVVVLNRLIELAVLQPKNQMRGFHLCEICTTDDPDPDPSKAPEVTWQGRSRSLGSAEIWVTTRSGLTYACPDLIVHYIDVHCYCPPRDFVAALLEPHRPGAS